MHGARSAANQFNKELVRQDVMKHSSPRQAHVLDLMYEAYGFSRAGVLQKASPRNMTEGAIFDSVVATACQHIQQHTHMELHIMSAHGELRECLHIFASALSAMDAEVEYDAERVAAIAKEAELRVESVFCRCKTLLDAACVEVRAGLEVRCFVHNYTTLPKLISLAQGCLGGVPVGSGKHYESHKLFVELCRLEFLGGALIMYQQHRKRRLATASNSTWLTELCASFSVDDAPQSVSDRRIVQLRAAIVESFKRAVHMRTQHQMRVSLLRARVVETQASTDTLRVCCERIYKQIAALDRVFE